MRTETANRSETRTVGTPVEARQGFRDRPVLVVLVVALLLVTVGFGAVWLGMF